MVDPGLRALYPFEGRTLDRDGLRLHFLDEGDGPPVLMVHGNPTWSFYYRDLVLGLRDGRRCIVPDHIGCGLSDKPGDDRYEYSLRQRVDDLEALADHCGLDDGVDLVVHDWGGMIGFAWAVRHSERIRRLVVLNTGAFHLPESKPLPWQLKLSRSPALGSILIRGFNAFVRGAVRDCVVRRPLAPDVRAGYLAPYDSWANRIAVLRFVEDIPLAPGDRGYDLVTEVQDGLERLRHVPMLICWGLRDFVFDHHFLAEWERRFPDAEVHRFEDAGHFVLEDARDDVVPLITDFLGSSG